MRKEDYDKSLMDENGFCNHEFVKTNDGKECRGCGVKITALTENPRGKNQ